MNLDSTKMKDWQIAEAAEQSMTPVSKLADELGTPLRRQVELIATEVYGADGVECTPEATEKAEAPKANPDFKEFGTCMVKTHLSLSHDPDLKGRPKNWTLPIRDFLVYKGAGFIVTLAGTMKLIPGTSSNPAFRRIDVDLKTGKVTGLFQTQLITFSPGSSPGADLFYGGSIWLQKLSTANKPLLICGPN